MRSSRTRGTSSEAKNGIVYNPLRRHNTKMLIDLLITIFNGFFFAYRKTALVIESKVVLSGFI